MTSTTFGRDTLSAGACAAGEDGTKASNATTRIRRISPPLCLRDQASLIGVLTLPLQPRRPIITPAADGCKRLLGWMLSRPFVQQIRFLASLLDSLSSTFSIFKR
jgi:hypothetical protein